MLVSSAAVTVIAFLILPTIPTELVPQTDEGQVSVSARLPVGSRIERAEAVALQLEQLIQEHVPEATTIMTSAGGGGFMGGGSSNVNVTVKLTPKDQRPEDTKITDPNLAARAVISARLDKELGTNALSPEVFGVHTNPVTGVIEHGNVSD